MLFLIFVPPTALQIRFVYDENIVAVKKISSNYFDAIDFSEK